MPRLKTLFALASLSSFSRRVHSPRQHIQPEPIRRTLDEDKTSAATDDWLFEPEAERAGHDTAVKAVSESLGRLRQTLSAISAHAPITVEAEPAMALGSMSFDRDLFDGEPMLFDSQPEADSDGMNTFLFDEERPIAAPHFSSGSQPLLQHAA